MDGMRDDPVTRTREEIRRYAPVAPYDFEMTADYATYNGSRYAADRFSDGVYSRAVEIDGKVVGMSIQSCGDVARPALQIRVVGDSLDPNVVDQVVVKAVRTVGAHSVLDEFYKSLSDEDPISEFARDFLGLGIPQSVSVFESLVLSILGQQISNQVARVLRNLLVDTLGRVVVIDGAEYHTFPSPEDIAEAGPDVLRGIKFSARKSEYICDIAGRVAAGHLDLDALAELPSDVIVEELVKLRGVGPWTAHWLLIRAFALPDGFPHGDLAVQRNLGILFNDGVRLAPEEALEIAERWKPFRSYATTYLFAAARSGLVGSRQTGRAVGP